MKKRTSDFICDLVSTFVASLVFLGLHMFNPLDNFNLAIVLAFWFFFRLETLIGLAKDHNLDNNTNKD
jgi:hypothetical protein